MEEGVHTLITKEWKKEWDEKSKKERGEKEFPVIPKAIILLIFNLRNYMYCAEHHPLRIAASESYKVSQTSICL